MLIQYTCTVATVAVIRETAQRAIGSEWQKSRISETKSALSLRCFCTIGLICFMYTASGSPAALEISVTSAVTQELATVLVVVYAWSRSDDSFASFVFCQELCFVRFASFNFFFFFFFSSSTYSFLRNLFRPNLSRVASALNQTIICNWVDGVTPDYDLGVWLGV